MWLILLANFVALPLEILSVFRFYSQKHRKACLDLLDQRMLGIKVTRFAGPKVRVETFANNREGFRFKLIILMSASHCGSLRKSRNMNASSVGTGSLMIPATRDSLSRTLTPISALSMAASNTAWPNFSNPQ